MNKKVGLVRFAGTMFMFVAALLFYQHLFVAASNPDFSVVVYFNYFGEGTIELILFCCFIPLIIFSFAVQYLEIVKTIKGKRYEKRSRDVDRK